MGLMQAPLQKHERKEDNSKPLFCGFIRLPAKIRQAQRLFDVEVVDLDGPALLIDAQDLLC